MSSYCVRCDMKCSLSRSDGAWGAQGTTASTRRAFENDKTEVIDAMAVMKLRCLRRESRWEMDQESHGGERRARCGGAY